MDENRMNKTEMPLVIKIENIVDENPSTKTFIFRHRLDYRPGQFIMLWLPGMDEKPFSVSQIDDVSFGVTVEKKGAYTEALHRLKAGDKLGIRGPYGNPFTPVDGKTCVVAGGCGIAPIMPLISNLENPTVIVGCQTKARLLFKDKVDKYNICTDDGSLGHKGFVTEQLAELFKTRSFDMVYTCGPEPMMKAVFELCEKHNILLQASLERFMICGIGICGQCMCDNLRICQDGPVLSSKQLRNLKDFGKSAMIKTGEKVALKEYYSYRTRY
jgi:dihydroorotate dehydrogenase electron transfer subunit